MANYPSGILLDNNGVILELVSEVAVNTFTNSEISFGYIRQLGASAFCGTVGDLVQYRTPDSLPFQQSGVTYAYVLAQNVFLRQTPPIT